MMGLGIAKALGANVAITSSSDLKLARVASLGADLTVNSRSEGWTERVREWSGGGVDVVLDIGGAATLGHSVRVGARRRTSRFAWRGRIGRAAARSCTDPDAPDTPAWDLCRQPVRARALLAFVADRRIAPIIDRVFEGLGSARQAFAHLVSGRAYRKNRDQRFSLRSCRAGLHRRAVRIRCSRSIVSRAAAAINRRLAVFAVNPPVQFDDLPSATRRPRPDRRLATGWPPNCPSPKGCPHAARHIRGP